ncbi:hypothetical protein AVEN_253659-1 [Araneus ventricosus]|uniref:Uncharacterized protein n=1 Tax=Araneus ventricosus TaxID=182803 RepID=A0A4Y2WRT0_ARAVE|nr:hypothetical protein AVEN_253659-1 [Araneus ventricosus]
MDVKIYSFTEYPKSILYCIWYITYFTELLNEQSITLVPDSRKSIDISLNGCKSYTLPVPLHSVPVNTLPAFGISSIFTEFTGIQQRSSPIGSDFRNLIESYLM